VAVKLFNFFSELRAHYDLVLNDFKVTACDDAVLVTIKQFEDKSHLSSLVSVKDRLVEFDQKIDEEESTEPTLAA
jgi:hypothetical protein